MPTIRFETDEGKTSLPLTLLAQSKRGGFVRSLIASSPSTKLAPPFVISRLVLTSARLSSALLKCPRSRSSIDSQAEITTNTKPIK